MPRSFPRVRCCAYRCAPHRSLLRFRWLRLSLLSASLLLDKITTAAAIRCCAYCRCRHRCDLYRSFFIAAALILCYKYLHRYSLHRPFRAIELSLLVLVIAALTAALPATAGRSRFSLSLLRLSLRVSSLRLYRCCAYRCCIPLCRKER